MAEASRAVSWQRHLGWKESPTGTARREAYAQAARSARPPSDRLRCVAQSSRRNPGGSPTPGVDVMRRMTRTWPPSRNNFHKASSACAAKEIPAKRIAAAARSTSAATAMQKARWGWLSCGDMSRVPNDC